MIIVQNINLLDLQIYEEIKYYVAQSYANSLYMMYILTFFHSRAITKCVISIMFLK